MAQLIPIVSEALQATVRRLLPSQSGFGEDLQAQNVIVPIIDLTPTAEGSILASDLQQSINFGGSTAFQAVGSSATLANTGGFYRVTGTCTLVTPSTGTKDVVITMSDGLSSKNVWRATVGNGTGNTNTAVSLDLIFFVDAGVTLAATADNNTHLSGSIRQVATAQGELVNPSGFASQ